MNRVARLDASGAPVSQLRRWLTALHEGRDEAEQLMRRSIAVLEQKGRCGFVKEFYLDKPIVDNQTEIYPLLSAHSLGLLTIPETEKQR